MIESRHPHVNKARQLSDDPVAILLTEVAVQNRVAFRSLYRSTSAKLFGVLLRVLNDKAEAEDALQEVFLRIWLRAASYDPARGRGITWLIAITRNLAIDRLRIRSYVVTGSDAAIYTLPELGAGIEARIVAAGEALRVCACFQVLDVITAQAVKGAYFLGLSYADLAVLQNVSVNTMRSRLRRGLVKLKDSLAV